MSFVVSNHWYKTEFKHAKVWDKRCIASLCAMAKAISEHEGASFSTACGENLRQCGSRIFSNEEMTTENMQAGHYQETARRAAHEGIILVAQDTTSFNYSSHKATTGLGCIESKPTARGIEMHTALALRQDGIPLGIIGQKQWVRKDEERGKKHKRKSLPIESKESFKWIDGLDWTIQRLSKKAKEIWLIADRESDVYEYLKSDRPKNVHLLTRACQPRIIEAQIMGHNERGRITEIVKRLPKAATKDIKLERANRTETITVAISYSNITVYPPKTKGKDAQQLEMSVIYVREVGEADEGEKIEWLLLCDKRDLTQEEAIVKLDYYTQRWKVERFHFTLKTGVFNVEKLQFDDGETLMNALSFYSVIAWHVLWITYYCRLEPEAKAEVVIDPVEKEVLEAYTKSKITTALQAGMAIGKLGGFFGGSKRYPFPGIKTMWLGITTLIAMKTGWLLAKSQFQKK